MSTVTDELLLRIAVEGGAVAAAEVASFDERIAAAGDTAVKTTRSMGGLSNWFFSFKALIAGFTIVDAVKQFASFQRQMEMIHTQAGATQAEVGTMSKRILEMATSVATGPNSLAQALYHIESIQLRGAKAADVLRTAAEGAKVGNANLVDVTNALDAVIVGKMVPGVNNFKAAMGQLNSTTGVGDMTMQNLADAMSTGVLGSLKRTGLQLIDVNAALAVLGDNNIRGAQAANRLRMSLLQVVKPTNEAAAELHALHMTTLQLAEDYFKPRGLYVMLEDLHTHLAKFGNTPKGITEANDVLMTLFGRGRNSAAIMTLYDQMDRLKTKYDGITKGQNDFAQMWAATQKTFSFTIDQLKTLGEVVLIKLGSSIKGVVEWFRKMGPLAKTIRDLAIAIGIMAVAWSAARVAVIAFNIIADANPWTLAIAAVLTIIIALIDHFGGLKKVAQAFATFWVHLWASVQAGVINAVNKAIGAINTLIRAYDSVIGKVPFFGGSLKIGQIGYDTPAGSLQVETSPNHYTPLYKLEQPGTSPSPNLNLSGSPTAAGANRWSPTPAGADMAPRYAIIELDGKPLARAVLKQGLNATARRGAGGPTISNTGS